MSAKDAKDKAAEEKAEAAETQVEGKAAKGAEEAVEAKTKEVKEAEASEAKDIATPEVEAASTDEAASADEGASTKTSRRSFLKWTAGVLGAGLVVGVGAGYQNRWYLIRNMMDYMANRHYDPMAFILIPPKGKIKLVVHRSEMGQGVRTSLPMIMAEDLGVRWDQIEIVQALGDPKYGSQNTDGSTSVKDFYHRLRLASAGIREMLERAAALKWDLPLDDCVGRDGHVVHLRSRDKKLSYQELSELAMQLKMPKNPKLKPVRDFKFIGKPRMGTDVPDIVQGKGQFGADIEVPGMVYAVAKRAPVPGGRIKSVDASAAKKVKGVIDVVKLEGMPLETQANDSVCVVATNTWAAMKGREALKVEWDLSGLKNEHSNQYKKELVNALADEKKRTIYRNDGYIDSVEARYPNKVSVEFHTPYLVHATMEPPVAVAHVTSGACEVWAPVQGPQRIMKVVGKMLGIPMEKVKVNVTLLGGGFGRKGQPDFVAEAVALSKKIKKPVLLQWTREDEVQHGFYHAEAYQKLSASLDKYNMPVTWRHQAVYPTITNAFFVNEKKNATPMIFELGMGSLNIPYDIANVRCETGDTIPSVRVGWLRSVCNLFQGYAVNAFMDELAERAKMDPVEYRLRLIGAPRMEPSMVGDPVPQDTGRLSHVIKKVRDAFGWDKPLPKGHGKGFANHYSFLSYVALAMEVSCTNGVAKVHRVVTAIDCGLAINPDHVKAQMEGAIVFGLSAGLYGKITLKGGAVEQSNFHDYPVLRANEMPKIDVIIVNGDTERPAGVGEPGVPVVVPALAAAIYNATGQRIRDLPLAEKLIA